MIIATPLGALFKLITLKWVPAFKQLADSLTKSMKDILLFLWKANGQVCRPLLTKQRRFNDLGREGGQRERRAARLKSSELGCEKSVNRAGFAGLALFQEPSVTAGVDCVAQKRRLAIALA